MGIVSEGEMPSGQILSRSILQRSDFQDDLSKLLRLFHAAMRLGGL